MRKGEIVRYKQFLLFSQCFPLLFICSASKCGIVWQWVKPSQAHHYLTSTRDQTHNQQVIPTHSHTMTPFDAPGKQAF